MLVGELTLGIGITLACSQDWGKIPDKREALNMQQTGSASHTFRPKMNVHFRIRFVFGRKWNFIFVGIFVYRRK